LKTLKVEIKFKYDWDEQKETLNKLQSEAFDFMHKHANQTGNRRFKTTPAVKGEINKSLGGK